jgi:hypothetical protein
LVTGFFNHEDFTSWAAGVVEQQGLEALVAIAVAQLEEIYPELEASKHFVKGQFHDWQKEPHIRCGYSHGKMSNLVATDHPSDHTSMGGSTSSTSTHPPPLHQTPISSSTAMEHHHALATPLMGGRVLFAGEAYVSEGSGANMTVHAALDQGHRAAGQAAEYLAGGLGPSGGGGGGRGGGGTRPIEPRARL